MAIILDGRVQGQPPVIKSQIGQHGQIELGAKPLQDAQDLALVLRAGALPAPLTIVERSEEHTSELQSHSDLVCRLLLEKKKNKNKDTRMRLGHRVRARARTDAT